MQFYVSFFSRKVSFLFVNVVFVNHVCQPRHFAHSIELWVTCHSAVQPACVTGVIVSHIYFPQFSRRARVAGACKLYSFVLGLHRPEKRENNNARYAG